MRYPSFPIHVLYTVYFSFALPLFTLFLPSFGSRSLSHITSSTTLDQPFVPFVVANKTHVNWHLHLNRLDSSMYTCMDINHVAHLFARSFIRFFASILTYFSIDAYASKVYLSLLYREIYIYCCFFILSNLQMSGIEEDDARLEI